MNWVVTYNVRDKYEESLFLSFETAKIFYKDKIKEYVDIEKLSETFSTWGSDDEESVEIYSHIVDFLKRFISDPQFVPNVDFLPEYYDDNYYCISSGESLLKVSDPDDECDTYALFDENGHKIESPKIGPFLTLSWMKVDEGKYEYDFELILYEEIYQVSLKCENET